MQELNKKKKVLNYGAICIVVLVVMVVAVIVMRQQDQFKISSKMAKQINFPIVFLKNPKNNYRVDKTSIKYSTQPDGSQVFSYVVYSPSNRVTISEQAYPDALVYDNLTNSLNPYSEVGTLYGNVTLGRPKDNGGKQLAAVKYTDSTLIFAKPDNDLSDNAWRSLFNDLETLK
jgi:hypothetical protein